MRHQIRDIYGAYELIRPRVKKFVENLDLISPNEFEFEGENSELLVWCECISKKPTDWTGFLIRRDSGGYETKPQRVSRRP